jgi:hypothetical protein
MYARVILPPRLLRVRYIESLGIAAIFKEPIAVANGACVLPNGPGLGVELDPLAVRRGRALVDMHMKLCDLQLTRYAGTIIFPKRSEGRLQARLTARPQSRPYPPVRLEHARLRCVERQKRCSLLVTGNLIVLCQRGQEGAFVALAFACLLQDRDLSENQPT